jgi:hypothetical protein
LIKPEFSGKLYSSSSVYPFKQKNRASRMHHPSAARLSSSKDPLLSAPSLRKVWFYREYFTISRLYTQARLFSTIICYLRYYLQNEICKKRIKKE